MKIAIDVREIRKDVFTGIGTFTRNFIKYLIRFAPEHTYILIGNQFTDLTGIGMLPPNFKTVIQAEKSTLLWDQVLLPAVLKRTGSDVFFSPYLKMPFFCPIPAVVTVHDYPLAYWVRKKNFKQIFTTLPSAYISARKAAKILTVSKNSKDDVVRYLRVPAEKISVVYNAAAPEYKFINRKKELRASFGIDENAFVIMYSGNLKKHKNVGLLIDVFLRLHKKYANVLLLIATSGGGYFFKKIEKAAKFGIILKKNMTLEQMNVLYNLSDLFVFLSEYEGFGLPVLEAMSCGLPVVSSDASSLPEVGGDAAYYVKPDSGIDVELAIEKIMNDRQLSRSLIERGLKNVERFSLQKVGGKILQNITGALND